MFLLDGWRAVFRVGIALLREMESKLLKMDMVAMCNYFRDSVRKEGVSGTNGVFRVFSEASKVRVILNQIIILIDS